MKMLKYRNKRIFVCLSLALVILILASFVASSVEDKEDVTIVEFDQKPRAKVTRDTTINFTWEITKTPSSYLTGKDYYLVILPGPLEKEVVNHTFKIEQKLIFSGKDSWEGSDERKLGRYTSILKVPYAEGYIEFKGIEFEVVETLLVILKFNDINLNEKVDNKDIEIQGWEFKVTDPDRKTTNKFTDVNGEIVIVVPKKYAGREYTIEEIPQPGWKSVLPIKQTVNVPVGNTTTVQFLNRISDTILIIRKFDDTNRNNRIDERIDKKLQSWEFKVTDPDGNTKTNYTNSGGEIVIDVPPEYAGKDYTVEEILQPGWKSILPSKQTVNVPEGETTTVKFLNAKTLLIIRKFDDDNRNSKIDSNDARLQGWKFNVTDPSRSTTTHFTNSQGEITIDVPGEHAGKEYLIEETLPVGWESVLPIEQPVHVNVPSGKTTSVQFLNRIRNTTLIIWKFDDSNQNNELDSEDKRLPGWNFSVVDPAGTTTTYTTDGNGTIKIKDVPEGDYSITEIIDAPDDWKLIKIATKAPIKEEGEQWIKIFVEEGKESIVQFLNNRSITRLRIQKFDDSNRNGKVDDGIDERLQGWNFTVTDPAGKPTTDITNDIRGEIIIEVPEEYVNKEYTIEEELKDGWNAILPEKQTVKVPKGRTTTVQFLNFCETELIIQKFDDTNRNKKIDNNDAIIRDWEFKVTDPTGNTKTYFTNIKGEIIIVVPKKYAEKEYTIEEKLKDGCKAITPTKQTRNVPEGKTETVQFLNFCNTSLTIHKFNDSNQNKVQDPGEQCLAWNFSITFPDGSVKRVTTAANGVYMLHNIPVGEYTIREEPRSCRWTSSTENPQKVDVTAGNGAIAPFGNYIAECCRLPGRMWNNSDKNIEVCKSVDPYSVALGNEEEVTVYLGLCVDPKHIINGTKVENISVIDTLHSQFTIVDGSFSKEPKYDPIKNPDGTTTIRWNISSLCCEEWRVSFNVTVAFALPIDVTESYGVSKVIYDDPDSEETKVLRKLPIPAGKLLFVLPTPAPTPTTTSSPTPEPPGFEALLAIAGLLAVAYMMWRRKR